MNKISYQTLKKIFNSKEIKILENKKLLICQDNVVFISTDVLICLGKHYLKTNPQRSIQLFTLTVNLDNTHPEIYLYLINELLKFKRYSKVLRYLEYVPRKNDYNFYLYLLKELMDLPIIEKNKVNNFTAKNFITNDEYKNKYRNYAIKGNYVEALTLSLKAKKKKDIDDCICYRLIYRIINNIALENELITLINNKKYLEALKILTPLRKKLPIRYTYIYVLIQKILNSGYVLNTDNMIINLINNNDYLKCYEIINNDKLIIYLLNILINQEQLTNDKLLTNNINIEVDDFTKITPWDISIDNIEEIIGSININGFSFTCEKYNLVGEKKYIVMALYAQECFKTHLFILGNRYLKLVKASPYKTITIKNLIQDIENSRKIYKNNHKEISTLILK